jgi:2-amino-4-hydroxy-6-hydroxymethyldihydropteridine diphosphokinase
VKKTVYLGLGSNLGDRRRHLEEALAELRRAGIDVRRISAIYESEPVDYLQQPWFLNCVVEAGTELMPMQLLKRLRQIEWRMGRRRAAPRGPRTIDIDILLYGRHVVDRPELTIPHPRLDQRRFALEPLRELAPELRHPVSKKTVTELLAAVADRSQVRRLSDFVIE